MRTLRQYGYFFSDEKVETRYAALAFKSAARVLQFIYATFATYIFFADTPAQYPQGYTIITTMCIAYIGALEFLLRNVSVKIAPLLHAHYSVALHLVIVALELICGVESYHSPKRSRVVPYELRAILYICTVHLCAAPATHHIVHATISAIALMRSSTVDELWSESPAASRAACFTLFKWFGRELLGFLLQKMMRDIYSASPLYGDRSAEDASKLRVQAGSSGHVASSPPETSPTAPSPLSLGQMARRFLPSSALTDPAMSTPQGVLAMLDFVNTRPEPLYPGERTTSHLGTSPSQ